jgi:hypothetical protein
MQMPFAPWYSAIIGQYCAILELTSGDNPRPVLATETCWGSASDSTRAEIVRDTLDVLRRHKIGYLPHALMESGVADLHLPTPDEHWTSSTLNPASMAFILRDGTLRPGHDAYNDRGTGFNEVEG